MGSSWTTDWTHVPCFGRRIRNHWTTRKVSDCKFYKRLCKQLEKAMATHSCLENPMDRGAWWAAVYGVVQSRTRLKRLSSSSSKQFPMHLKMYLMEVWMPKYILKLDLMVYFQIPTLYIWKLKHRDIDLSLITHPESLWAWCGLSVKTQSHYVLCCILLLYGASWVSASQDAGAVTLSPGCT